MFRKFPRSVTGLVLLLIVLGTLAVSSDVYATARIDTTTDTPSATEIPSSTSTPTQAADESLRRLADQSNFHIGAAVYTFHLDDPVHAQTLSSQFNMLTPEEEAKFCELQPQQNQFDFSKFDRLVDFAEQNHMVVRGHNLVWHQCLPSWVTSGSFTRDQAIQILHDHIFTVMGRYKGRVTIWDVVNEAIADDGSGLRDGPWRTLIGDDYVELAFRFAHEADPDAILFYNDYGGEGMGAKSNAIYAMVKDFAARGVPINGVGLQTHIALGDTAPGGALSPDALAQNIQRLGQLGLQVQITEMDVKFEGQPTDDILRRQAADYHRVLDTCLNSTYCTAFVTWGVTDKFSWLRDARYYTNPNVAPLLFDDKYQPKPAYFAVQDLLARHAGQAPVLSDDQVAAMLGQPNKPSVEIPTPSKSDPAQLAPDSVAGAVYYAPFPVKITLDGNEDDWANVPRVTVNQGPLLPNNDTSFTFAAAADDTHLYFLADVHDSKLIYGVHDPTTEWYKEDSVEFYLNTTGDLTLTAYQPGVAQIGIMAANITHPAQPIIGGGNSADAQVSVYAVQTTDGYRIEASVPLTTKVWSIKPFQGEVLGFQAHLNGASSSTDRDTKLIWSAADTQDQSYANPSLFGQLIFWYRHM